MFQGVMDKGQRRELGAHYTSEEFCEDLDGGKKGERHLLAA